jgi:hypothetical protein
VQARRLSPHRVHSGGCDLNIFAIADETPEQPLSHRAAANVAGADKEDAFHGDGTGAMPVRAKLRPN